MARPREQRRRQRIRAQGDGHNKFKRRMKALLAKAPPGWTPPFYSSPPDDTKEGERC